MIQELTVGLCQINAGFSGQFYLPYSVGLLEAYAKKYLKEPHRYRFPLPVYKREPVAEAVEKLLPADIVGISLYVWNTQLSLAIARELKARKPEIIIVAGGPHVPDAPGKYSGPDRSELFLKQNPFIDIAAHGEGEAVFSAILEHMDDWSAIPSISYLVEGKAVHNPRLSRMNDLDVIPSPYLEDTFSPLMAANPDNKWIAVWETNRGCPFSCSFCDWGSAIAAKVNKWSKDHVYREVDWFAKHEIQFIFCADANFGILPRDVEIAKYCAEVKARTGYPSAITVSNTKNATERSFEVQKLFAISGLNTGATVSMQSMDKGTLQAIKRDNINLDKFKNLQREFKNVGIQANTDIILCLPGETYDTFTNGVDELITSGQHDRILFYNLTILPNAEMGDPAYQKRFGMETVVSGIINIHGSKSGDAWDVPEIQDLVITTNTMPREDWVRVRVFSWFTQFLHFDKLLQMPLVLMHELAGATYRELIELFSEGRFGTPEEFPTLAKVRDFFIAKAKDIQGGGAEFCHATEWLDIWWPTDEYMFIKLAMDGELGLFYREASQALVNLLKAKGREEYREVISEAVHLNRQMLKMPFQRGNEHVPLLYNVWEFYQAAIRGETTLLKRKPSTFVIDKTTERWGSWEDWYRVVVWYSSKRGAYLYPRAPEPEPVGTLAGHF